MDEILEGSPAIEAAAQAVADAIRRDRLIHVIGPGGHSSMAAEEVLWRAGGLAPINAILDAGFNLRSEEHTSEFQSLMRTSSAVFCLKKKNHQLTHPTITNPPIKQP